ncbi:MAG: COQ9 family protein [Rhodospirillaceae bacterium]|nr:COQ9 family protein [Rhodospirillaceae bacterium]MBT7450798.1 COQ9 family protein [Rhodospirillaceae bacterium]
MTDKNARRDAIILAALVHIPFDGWTIDALNRGAADAGLTPADVDILFPQGPRAAVRHWLQMADRLMLKDLAETDLEALRIRDRIAMLVRTRLERWTLHREAVRRALAISILPGFAEDGLRSGYATVDAMWRAAGDRSTDYNFYTKRGLLAAVYSSTLLVWLDDRSEGCADTWAFLDRRIADVMKVPKAQARVKEVLSRLPNPLSLFRRARRTA